MIAARPLTTDEFRAIRNSSDRYNFNSIEQRFVWRIFTDPGEAALVIDDAAIYGETTDELKQQLQRQLSTQGVGRIDAGAYRTCTVYARDGMPELAGTSLQLNTLAFRVSAVQAVQYANYAAFMEAVDLMGGQPLTIDFSELRELLKDQPIVDKVSASYLKDNHRSWAPSVTLVVGSLVITHDPDNYKQVIVRTHEKRAKRLLASRRSAEARKAAPKPFDGTTGYSALRDLAKAMVDLLLPRAPFETSGVHYPSWDVYDAFFKDIGSLCNRIPDLYALLEKFDKGPAVRKLMKAEMPKLLHVLRIICTSLANADVKRAHHIATYDRNYPGHASTNDAAKVRHKFIQFLMREVKRAKTKGGVDKLLAAVQAIETKFGLLPTEFGEPAASVAVHPEVVPDVAPPPVVSPGIADSGPVEGVAPTAPGPVAVCGSVGEPAVSS